MKASRTLVIWVSLAATARADISVTQVGVTNGDDWEPAIAVDGQDVYATWAHFGLPQQDSAGATCKTKGVASYAYFQRSTNGGATWDPYIIPRCPVSGTQVDVQVVVGPNHRVYVSYMDGPQANSNVELVYSDDHGATWSSPVDAVAGGGGDKHVLLVDKSGGVLIAYEHLSSAYVAYSPNPGACGLFNNYTRTSVDGVTWTSEVKMQLPTTHSYQVATPAPGGLYHPYGDYTSMATDGTTTWAVWGEGTSYIGPGTIYTATF